MSSSRPPHQLITFADYRWLQIKKPFDVKPRTWFVGFKCYFVIKLARNSIAVQFDFQTTNISLWVKDDSFLIYLINPYHQLTVWDLHQNCITIVLSLLFFITLIGQKTLCDQWSIDMWGQFLKWSRLELLPDRWIPLFFIWYDGFNLWCTVDQIDHPGHFSKLFVILSSPYNFDTTSSQTRGSLELLIMCHDYTCFPWCDLPLLCIVGHSWHHHFASC